ncbi:MAG TPA: hypothetical protein VFW34_06790 [Candidatus Rubrimentiphilum sp.]|nr:hypothetical protein [Candidatus Rubrimentiphilum sp.]
MEGRAIRGVAAGALCALTFCIARAANTEQTGQYALVQGHAKIVSRLSLTKGAFGTETLALAQYPLHSASPLTRYVLTEGETLHVVAVRDDFQSFGHLHPQIARCGVFRLPVLLERGHRYYAFVSSQPAGLPEQVFRFVLQSGTALHNLTTTLKAPSLRARAGPYDVSLDQARLHAMRPETITADINRDPHSRGVAVPYHVVWVRAFIINTSSLTYAHIGSASARGICCEYALRAPPLAKGLYKMWLQFNDGNATYTAPFSFSVQ